MAAAPVCADRSACTLKPMHAGGSEYQTVVEMIELAREPFRLFRADAVQLGARFAIAALVAAHGNGETQV